MLHDLDCPRKLEERAWFKHGISGLVENEDSVLLALTHCLYFWFRPSYWDEDRDFEVWARLVGAQGMETMTSEVELVPSDRLCWANCFFCGVEGVYRKVATIMDIYMVFTVN